MKVINSKICLSTDPENKPVDEENVITIDDVKYTILPLNTNYLSSKGGNSNVYKLKDEKGNEFAIKFSNYFRPIKKSSNRGYLRFLNEIKALQEVKERDFQNVVSIISDGEINLDGKDYPYFIMEKADLDLKDYLYTNPQIDFQQKFFLCKEIFKAIKELHSIGIYHRDIKPDNILLFISDDKISWKIADLGLIKYRDIDNEFDKIGEKIGPFGWLAPEAMNKFLTEESNIGLDCKIDHNSDIFMLGELFWFVFKLNIPLGQIKKTDFDLSFPESDTYFELVQTMLSHSKNDRTNLEDIEFFLDNIGKELFI